MTLGHFLSSEYDEIIPLAGGSGGQGTVFRARHREFGQLRAVKWLHGSIESSPTDKSQPNKANRLYEVFLREARNLMQLNTAYHPNIVRIYNARLIEHHTLWFPILEMELIEGRNLNTLIEQGESKSLPIAEVESLIGQLASALAHCHRLSVIHRDIKSHNVMLDSQANKFVLVDYGLSLLAGEPVSQERRGTPQYMSPEQYQGLDPSYQSDIYSLGVVLYEALTGQLPFGPQPSNDHWRFYAQAHLHTEVIPIRSLRPEVPPWLEEVIRTCLAKNPPDRFANGQALVSYLATKSIPPVPAPRPVSGLTLPTPEWAIRPPVPPPSQNPVAKPSVSDRPEPPRVDRSALTNQRERRGGRAIGWLVLAIGLLAGLYWFLSSEGTPAATQSQSDDGGQEALSQATAFERAGQYRQAAEIYQRLIEGGEASAYKPLFQLYMGGRVGGAERCQKAFGLLRAAADADDYLACNLLGYVYEYGEYINQGTGQVLCQYVPNAALAFQYVQKAALGGNRDAMQQLALYYQRGFGTSIDQKQANSWRQKAREASSAH